MANLRIRINNFKALEEQLPKLQRSISAQKNVEMVDEGHGYFLLTVKDRDLKSLKVTLESIKGFLDNYGFCFFYGHDQEEEREPAEGNFIPGCDCEICKYEQQRWEQQQQHVIKQQELRALAEQRQQAAMKVKAANDQERKKTIKQLLEEAVKQMNEAKKKIRN